ncbi:hypothetical protein [Hathewaya massiliensis]|uniref:hypothetical protein n=1 Tax=Hathewaya massiliensis TaxID=1964382 RepID=UPI0011573D73|nr:hypothetical protein [Hathewaya massiliensis]
MSHKKNNCSCSCSCKCSCNNHHHDHCHSNQCNIEPYGHNYHCNTNPYNCNPNFLNGLTQNPVCLVTLLLLLCNRRC